MKYRTTKTFGHDLGWSVAFRQWRADRHCSFLHGYALSVSIEFGSNDLDARNWCVDFGGLKPLREKLANIFDHKTYVAADDPALDLYKAMQDRKVMDLMIVDQLSCELFAKMVAVEASQFIKASGLSSRVKVISTTIKEHGANSASYYPEIV